MLIGFILDLKPIISCYSIPIYTTDSIVKDYFIVMYIVQ